MEKRGALELSIGTIVVIVIAMFMLIFGIIFVRNVMCSGIVLTDQISVGVENEIKNLFGSRDYGVRCMGEGGQEARFGDGGDRPFACVINTDVGGEYNLKITELSEVGGVDVDWLIDTTPEWNVGVGSTTITVGLLRVPKNLPATTLKIVLEETSPENPTGRTHVSHIQITHVGTLTSAMC